MECRSERRGLFTGLEQYVDRLARAGQREGLRRIVATRLGDENRVAGPEEVEQRPAPGHRRRERTVLVLVLHVQRLLRTLVLEQEVGLAARLHRVRGGEIAQGQ